MADETEKKGEEEPKPGGARTFLVLVDDSEEMNVALRFACGRARNTGGRVALLRVIEPGDFQHWMAVEALMREEARTEAEQMLQRIAEKVHEDSGMIPILYVREGEIREEVLAVIDEEPDICVLVLASSTGSEGPGPVISYLVSRARDRLRVPMTIVPGKLSDEEIDAIT